MFAGLQAPLPHPHPTACALHTSSLSPAPQAPQYLLHLHCSRLPRLGAGLQLVVQASTSACPHVTRRRAWGVRPPLESKTRALGLRIVPLALTHTDAFILALAQLQRARSQAQAILVGDPPMAMGAILFRSIEFGVIVSAKHLHLRQHPLRQHPLAAAPSRLELPPSGFLVPPSPAPPSPPRASQSSVFCVSQRCALCSDASVVPNLSGAIFRDLSV